MIDVSFSSEVFVSLIHAREKYFVHEHPIQKIVWDTRGLEAKPSYLFVALKGPHHDGHVYVEEAYQRGVRHFLVSQKPVLERIPHANVYVVDDTVDALQQLSLHVRQKFTFPVIAITGSNGKTIVKEWLYQLLSYLQPEPVFRSPKSFNSQIGVPFSILMASGGKYAYGIFETGISFPKEMKKLADVLQPTMGIFTNLGSAHQAHFSSFEQKAFEKAILFTHANFVVYSSSYPDIEKAFSTLHFPREKRITWGSSSDDHFFLVSQERHEKGVIVTLIHAGETLHLDIPFFDQGSIENALNVYVFLRMLQFPHDKIQQGLYLLSPVEMRLEVKKGKHHCLIINDTYNSDLQSIKNAFEYLDRFPDFSKRTVILSDVLQTHVTIEELHAFLLHELLHHHVSKLITVGQQFASFVAPEKITHQHFKSTEDLLLILPQLQFQDELVLLKGARPFAFERIGVLLEDKLHRTRLEINLSALAHNLQEIRSRLSSEVKVIAMMKAFGYGGGSLELARYLAYRNVHFLAVAYTDEAVELRKSGIGLPIIVLEPAENDFLDVVLHDLEIEIYNFAILQALIKFIKQFSSFVVRPIRIHIKLDTGMHRLGFQPHELNELIQVLKKEKNLTVVSVFSHFSAADDPRHDEFTRSQFSLFLKMSEEIQQALGYSVMRHIANSAAVIRFPEIALDGVRLGISLLGQSLVKDIKLDLHPVLSLKAPIIAVKEIRPGESVGYNRRWIKNYSRRVAILPVGYADGIDRRLGNNQWEVYFQDQFFPIVGDICMDMCFVDVTNIPHVRIGDEVEIFGPHARVEIMAKKLDTIPYEIFTRISKRVNRVYVE